MIAAAHEADTLHPAETATVPVKEPFMHVRKEYFRSTNILLNIRTEVPAVAVARMVLVIAVAIASPSPGCEILPFSQHFEPRNQTQGSYHQGQTKGPNVPAYQLLHLE